MRIVQPATVKKRGANRKERGHAEGVELSNTIVFFDKMIVLGGVYRDSLFTKR